MASKKTFFKVSGNMSDTPATVYARIEEDIVTAIAKNRTTKTWSAFERTLTDSDKAILEGYLTQPDKDKGNDGILHWLEKHAADGADPEVYETPSQMRSGKKYNYGEILDWAGRVFFTREANMHPLYSESVG